MSNTEQEIRDTILNIDKAISKINKFPQTYNTLLQQCKSNGTYQMIVRRKLNNMWKDGYISKAVIPGTRRGLVLFTSNEPDYEILVESARTGVNVYCFYNFEWKNDFALTLDKYWKLESEEWIEHNKPVVISKGSILKWI